MLYEVEKELRSYILNSTRENRSVVSQWAYDELFRRCPWHPALTEKSGMNNEELIQNRAKFIVPILNRLGAKTVLDIGCGHGELVLGLTREGFECEGVEISTDRINKLAEYRAEKLKIIQGDAADFHTGGRTFDVAISMQLFEHLHPEDVPVHLKKVHCSLNPEGYYLVETPNKYIGPGDVSRFFSDTPQGFHLKEYSLKDMDKILFENGFRLETVLAWKTRRLNVEYALFLEFFWKYLPKKIRLERTFGLHNPIFIAKKIEAVTAQSK